MLRGSRWQLLALLISLIVFAASVAFRIFDQAQPQITMTATSVVTESNTGATAIATEAATQFPATAVATQVAPVTTSFSEDDVATYREALIGAVNRLNPLLALNDTPEHDITSLIFEGLTQINEFGETVGLLAESWVVSRDGREYVFQLRQDILWQDGISFTADDVVYTISLLSDRDFPGLPELSAFWRTVEAQKLDAHLVRFRLAQPLSSFPSNLTVGILPEHVLRGTTALQLTTHPFNLRPIGTGPYQWEAWRSTDGNKINAVDLRPAPVYQQRPEAQGTFAIERVRFMLYDSFDEARNALQNNSVHGLAAPSMNARQQLANLPGVNIYTEVEPAVGIMIFNWDEGEETRFFQDRRVRRALQLGMNRRGPIERYLSNQALVADSPIVFTSWAYHPNLNWPLPDIERAQDLINNANIRFASDAETTPEPDAPPDDELAAPITTFSILVPDNPAITSIAQEIATQWSALNLEVTVEAQPAAHYHERVENADFAAAIVELQLSSDPDVYAYWHSDQYPEGRNYGGVADDRLSDLLERARRDPNGLNRVELYRQFQDAFIERAIAIPLYYPLYTYAVNERVEGVQLGFMATSAHRFRTIQSWRISD